jgi:universal stress protein A
MAVYQRILLAVDLTQHSLYIGKKARELAAALDAHLELLHVVEPVPLVVPVPPEPVVPVVVQTQAELIDIARGSIQKLARELGIPEDRWTIEVGDTRTEIVRVARDAKMDLIVVGARERHALAFLIKPTEDTVLRRAPCDVLAVRVPSEDDTDTKK